MAWLAGWNYRKKITIQHANVDGNLTDFPALIFIDADGDIGGHVSDDTDGLDIRFTEDDGDTLLKYEREDFAVAAGDATGYFWVKIPTILAAGGSYIYIYYNDGDGTVDGADPTNVWDANFKMVLHLANDNGNVDDSTSNNNDGTKKGAGEPAEVAGKIHKGQDFDGGDDYIDIDTVVGEISGTGPGTVEVLFKMDALANGRGLITFSDLNGNEYLRLGLGGTEPNLKVYAICKDNGANDWIWESTNIIPNQQSWHQLVVVQNETEPVFYLDSVPLAGTFTTDTDKTSWFDQLGGIDKASLASLIYNSNARQDFVAMLMDEVRVSITDRAAEWVKFSYHNMFEGDNELTWVAEEEFLQALLPDAIASAEAFGTQLLKLKLLPSAIASTEAFGTQLLKLKLLPSAIASLEAFGGTQLNLRMLPSGISSLEAFGTQLLKLKLLPSAIASLEAFGTGKVNLKLTPDAIASLEAFENPKLNLELAMTGIASAESVGSPQLNLKLIADAIASSEAFGTLLIGIDQTLLPDAITSLEAFGTQQLNLKLLMAGIASSEAFGTLLIGIDQTLLPDAIASLEAFGTGKVNLVIIPSGVISTETFGSTVIVLDQTLSPDAIASLEAFGTPLLKGTEQTLSPDAIASLEAFGVHTVFLILGGTNMAAWLEKLLVIEVKTEEDIDIKAGLEKLLAIEARTEEGVDLQAVLEKGLSIKGEVKP